MQEEKNPNATGSHAANESAADRERKEEATSSETLSEMEETEKVSGTEEAGRSSTPSPDGAFDSGQDRGPRDDPGPM